MKRATLGQSQGFHYAGSHAGFARHTAPVELPVGSEGGVDGQAMPYVNPTRPLGDAASALGGTTPSNRYHSHRSDQQVALGDPDVDQAVLRTSGFGEGLGAEAPITSTPSDAIILYNEQLSRAQSDAAQAGCHVVRQISESEYRLYMIDNAARIQAGFQSVIRSKGSPQFYFGCRGPGSLMGPGVGSVCTGCGHAGFGSACPYCKGRAHFPGGGHMALPFTGRITERGHKSWPMLAGPLGPSFAYPGVGRMGGVGASFGGDGSQGVILPGQSTGPTANAQAMKDALSAHGYSVLDKPLYVAVQADAGLAQDGFPGPNTMNAMGALVGFPVGVPVFPWSANCGPTLGDCYNGVNAPLLSQWNPAADPSAPANAEASQPVPQPNTGGGPGGGSTPAAGTATGMSTAEKVAIGAGVAAAGVGGYFLYKHYGKKHHG
jgi:hypothetical protein